MISNITIGQYYPADSYIHSLDPRVKLLAVIVYISMLFFITSFLGYLFVFLCLVSVIYASKIPIRYMLRGLRGLIFIISFTVVLNMFFTPGEKVLISLFGIKLTEEALVFAAKMALRLIFLITGSSILTLTTSPLQLTDAIESLLKPLKAIGVPAHEIAMMMTIALRFIPTLLEETDKIMKAQMARGADFDSGNLMKKAKSLIPLLVPLFISSFRRADDLAMAMESRCYRGDVNRTKMKEMKLTSSDFKALVVVLCFIAAVMCLRLVGQ